MSLQYRDYFKTNNIIITLIGNSNFKVLEKLILAHRGKLGMMTVKKIGQKKLRNLDHITYNDCGEKYHYAVNSE